MDDLEFAQSRFGLATRFRFGPQAVAFTFRDSSGECRFDVPYENIAFRAKRTITSNNNNFAWRLRLLPLAGFVVSFPIVKAAPNIGAVLGVASMLALAGLFACTYLKLFSVKIIIVPTSGEHPPLRVIDVPDGACILDELDLRWKARLKLLYGRANVSGDQAAELGRLTSLRDLGVLDANEFDAEVARLRAAIRADAEITSRLLN